MKESNKVFNNRSKKQPEPTYTKKQITKALLGWALFAALLLFFFGMVYGWYSRVDFESTMQSEVNYQIEQKLKK